MAVCCGGSFTHGFTVRGGPHSTARIAASSRMRIRSRCPDCSPSNCSAMLTRVPAGSGVEKAEIERCPRPRIVTEHGAWSAATPRGRQVVEFPVRCRLQCRESGTDRREGGGRLPTDRIVGRRHERQTGRK